ncbi:WD40-repeat-containing domain protein [Umbelopsis sp. PMI_123]|nr:WD40-repeat-containing domain protein [Umbelopsis sp. PMI_123]
MVTTPDQLLDKASDSSKGTPSPFDDGEEIDSDDEYEDSDEEVEENEEDGGDMNAEFQVGSDSGFGNMHDPYSRSPNLTSVKQKRAPPPPPVSRRDRIAQRHQNTEAPHHQNSQPPLQMQDPLRHIPIKPILTDQPAKPPRLEAATTEKPPALDSAPPLPTRPTDSRASSISRSSTIHSSNSRNLGTSEGSLSDYSSPGLRRNQTIARTERLLGVKIYPDHANANRSPPYINGSPITVHHRGNVRLFAMSGQHIVTGSQNTRIFNSNTGINTATIDHTAPNDINNRVCSMAFAPSLTFHDEGRYLWLGMQDGTIIVVDVFDGDIVGKRTDAHSAPITTILRYGNEEIWTIDDAGHMNAWPIIKGSIARGHTNHPLELHPRREIVSGRLNLALLVNQQLWMASGRVLDVNDVDLSGGTTNRAHARVPNNVGNITQLAAVPYHPGKVFVGHDDGKVTVWDTQSFEIVQTITLSIYGVSCLLAVGEHHLWAGYNTGMIYVYDTRPERWEVIKMWKAHSVQVTHLVLDETPLINDNSVIQVASLDLNGTIQIWDGLLTDNWRGKYIKFTLW